MFLSHNIGADLSWVDGWVEATIFPVACRELRTSIMAPGELPIVKIFLLKKLGKRRTKVLLDFRWRKIQKTNKHEGVWGYFGCCFECSVL